MKSRELWSVGLATVIASVGFSAEPAWTDETEKSLQELISKERVIVEMYLSEREFNGKKFSMPLHRLHVPERFVEIYRVDPIACRTALAEIVEHGSPHDAIVAFQFGYAGDSPQFAMPPLVSVGEKEIDEPFSDKETYRQCCLRVITKLLDKQKKRQQGDQPSPLR